MPESKLAGGARPRSAFIAATSPGRARITLTPSDDGEPLSLWASVNGETVTLDVDAPEVAAGWGVSARGLSGTVSAVNGRALTVEVSP